MAIILPSNGSPEQTLSMSQSKNILKRNWKVQFKASPICGECTISPICGECTISHIGGECTISPIGGECTISPICS